MLFEGFLLDFFRLLPGEKLRRKKRELRSIMNQKARVMTHETREEESKAIVENLKQVHNFVAGETIMCYYPTHHEVDIRPLLEEFKDTKTILLPVAHRRFIEMRRYAGKAHLHRGKFGIPEPSGVVFTGRPSLIIVPGIAFDASGNRMGHGGGYYDRFLKKYHDVPVIGVAFDYQMVKKVPHNHRDRKVDMVVTPKTTYINPSGHIID